MRQHARQTSLLKGRIAWRFSELHTCPELYQKYEDLPMAKRPEKKATPKATPRKPAPPPVEDEELYEDEPPVKAAHAMYGDPEEEEEETVQQQQPSEEEDAEVEEQEDQSAEEESSVDEPSEEETAEVASEEESEEVSEEQSTEEEQQSDSEDPVLQATKERVQALGLDWSVVGTVVSVFGQDGLQLAQELLDKGFSVDWVHEAFSKLEPEVIMLWKQYLQYKTDNNVPSATMQPPGHEDQEADAPLDQETLVSQHGLTVQHSITGVLTGFGIKMLLSRVLAMLPAVVQEKLGGHEQEIKDFLSRLLTS